MNKIDINSPKVLGLDVSTKTIGIALFDVNSEHLLELTHLSPVPKSEMSSKIENNTAYMIAEFSWNRSFPFDTKIRTPFWDQIDL